MNAGTRTGPFTVWLASYPKSGNTWTRAVLQSLTPPDVPLGAGAAEASCVDINALVGTPMAGCRATIDAYLGFAASDLLPGEIDALRPAVDAAVDAGLDRILFRKAHDALFSGPDGAPIVSATATRAAIYLVRDPRDVAVSFARFEARSPSAVVASMADPGRALSGTDRRLSNHARQRLGTWSQHVESWTCHDLFPVAVFRYEDLHADPVGSLKRATDMVAPVETGQIETALERCSPENSDGNSRAAAAIADFSRPLCVFACRTAQNEV